MGTYAQEFEALASAIISQSSPYNIETAASRLKKAFCAIKTSKNDRGIVSFDEGVSVRCALADMAMAFIKRAARIRPCTYRQVVAEMTELQVAKGNDYGDSFEKQLKELGLIVGYTRIMNKADRYIELADKGTDSLVGDEKLYDTLVDGACYCIMTLLYAKGYETVVEDGKKVCKKKLLSPSEPKMYATAKTEAKTEKLGLAASAKAWLQESHRFQHFLYGIGVGIVLGPLGAIGCAGGMEFKDVQWNGMKWNCWDWADFLLTVFGGCLGGILHIVTLKAIGLC